MGPHKKGLVIQLRGIKEDWRQVNKIPYFFFGVNRKVTKVLVNIFIIVKF